MSNYMLYVVSSRMIISWQTLFFLLTCLYPSARSWALETRHDETSQFFCSFSNNTLKLVMNNGFKEEQVIKCLEAYNTSETLIFSKSRLKTIPEYLNILNNLINLDLSYNDIALVSFTALQEVCKKLKQLVLDNNDIHVLRRGDLDCLESLEKVYIAKNNLSVVENGTFSTKLKALDYIHLVDNNLTTIDSSLFSKLLLSTQIHMTVNASLNRITGFTNSINITIEYVSRLTVIYVVLTHNNITTVDKDYYFKMFNITKPFLQLLYLWNCGFDARFNPFICDCALLPLAKELRMFYKTMDQDNPVFSITCGSPVSLAGMMVRKVQPNQFNCSVTHNCPDSCTCTKTVALGLIKVDCNNDYQSDDLPTTCPVAEKININIKSDDLAKISSRDYLRNVTNFDVSHCEIVDIDPNIVEALNGGLNKSVYLHDNNLQNIPKTFQKLNFNKIQLLTIDGNHFRCDCHTLWMKKWLLSNKNHVYYQDKIICESGPGKGRPMVEVSDNRFVCRTSLTLVATIFIIVGSLLALILLVAVTAWKINSIRVFMISHFDICKYCFRRRTRRRLLYDIFIPHSCEDDYIIEEILNELEHHNPPYKVCIGERDFEPGKTISENILIAIESIHTTLLFISNNFLRSAWCNMEFREAHMRFLRDRNINMILVILEDLETSLIYEELTLYLETHVYLRYNDRHFRAKLLQSLPIMLPSDETSSLLPN